MKLYVVGVGPGDPELLTLKAKRILAGAPLIFYPTGGRETLALSVVERVLSLEGKRLIALTFPMRKDLDLLPHYQKLAQSIVEELAKPKLGAFLVLGDPAFYATFYYLNKELHRLGVELEVIPGISSFSAGASKEKIPLTIGNEKMLLLPSESLKEIPNELLERIESLVIMKAKKNLEAIEKLQQMGFTRFNFFQRLYLDGEITFSEPSRLKEFEPDYFSFIILKKEQDKR